MCLVFEVREVVVLTKKEQPMKKMQFFMLLCLLVLVSAPCFAELEGLLNDGQFVLTNLPKYKRALALDTASVLNEANNFELLTGKLSARNGSLDMLPLVKEMATLCPTRAVEQWADAVKKLDSQIREAKGISDRLETILEVRLAFPDRAVSKDMLVAYIPAGSEKSWKFIEAFDLAGNVHKLDVHQTPEKQVLVVGLNAKKDMQAGLALMNDEFKKAGMQPALRPSREGGIDVAKLDYIRLNDDQEPWISGDAEIYTLVNGISPEVSKASVIAMEMPYLVTDDKDYYPNQVLIVWQNYRYKAANLNIYEHDDNTNYKELVASLIQAIGQIAPEYQMIAEIASKIVRLMPDSWFSNDDDYVDVYYTLEKGKTYTNQPGVSGNAKITLVPYFIPE
jgi:hypothetical protein